MAAAVTMVEAVTMAAAVIMVEAVIMAAAAIMVEAVIIVVDFMAAAIGVAVATGAAGDAGIGGTGFGTHTVCNWHRSRLLHWGRLLAVPFSMRRKPISLQYQRASSNCLNANTICKREREQKSRSIRQIESIIHGRVLTASPGRAGRCGSSIRS
ncbi:MAG TPA: hypothetical protein VGP86_11700 [Xanthobacteraceae bacterium]|nr:hypothetical protein [Xanthobacteraceae bacterium]